MRTTTRWPIRARPARSRFADEWAPASAQAATSSQPWSAASRDRASMRARWIRGRVRPARPRPSSASRRRRLEQRAGGHDLARHRADDVGPAGRPDHERRHLPPERGDVRRRGVGLDRRPPSSDDLVESSVDDADGRGRGRSWAGCRPGPPMWTSSRTVGSIPGGASAGSSATVPSTPCVAKNASAVSEQVGTLGQPERRD